MRGAHMVSSCQGYITEQASQVLLSMPCMQAAATATAEEAIWDAPTENEAVEAEKAAECG